jgi:HSP20 family protein
MSSKRRASPAAEVKAMSNPIDALKRTFADAWESVESGWQRVRAQAADALTRFRRGARELSPARADDELASPGWGLLASDVIEDDRRVVVRLEVPGMSRDDLDLQVIGDTLVVSGEKRYESDDIRGQWRVRQCAVGAFRRVIPLPVPVRAEEAKATCRDGVLRVELPKREPGAPRSFRLLIK